MKRKQIALLSVGHIIMDINQGALPALIPFLIVRHNLTYAAAAGIVFAANVASSMVQPLFGYFADRLSKSWLIPAGLLSGGAGFALIGVVPNYWLIFAIVAISGIGIAAFHPEAARLANLAAEEKSGTGMSLFATGGYLGYAIGPLFITGIVVTFGLKGTLFLIVPVSIMALVFIGNFSQFSAYDQGIKRGKTGGATKQRQDNWNAFGRLTATVLSRASIFYGLNTFIPLYWVDVLHQSRAAGGTALTILFTAGVVGALLGGRLADRFGYIRVVLTALIMLTLMLPVLAFLSNARLATLLLAPIGFLLFASFSPLIVLGQKYLPNRVGFASGVTLGLAVTVGGVAAPLLGKIADLYGLHTTLIVIAFLPVLPTCLAFTLPAPERL